MTDFPTNGEEIERRQRRRYWGILGAIAVVAAPIGGVIGFYAGSRDFNIAEAVTAVPAPMLAAMAAIYVLALTLGTWKFVTVIDEVELADNLWGSAAGFYFYCLVFPVWWFLWKAGFVGEPHDWAIFVVTMFVAIGVYLLRKWQAR